MSFAFRCEVCDGKPQWRIMRRGDAVVTWACDGHLSTVSWRLQRYGEITELVVIDTRKSSEWNAIDASLQTIYSESLPAHPTTERES